MKYYFLGAAALFTISAVGARHAPPGSLDSSARRPVVKRDSPMTGSQVAVFWGQNNTLSLSDVCSSGYYDVVMLAFVEALNPPAVNLADLTGPASAAQSAKEGWHLADFTVAPEGMTSVAQQVTACQSAGIKVMASFGGTNGVGYTRAQFYDADDARTSASNLWNLYLGGTDMPDLRPFGRDVILDGVDLDNETGDGSYYDTFIPAVRKYMDGDASRAYYLSAAPMASQVARGDATSIPASLFGHLDFVSVQFYNDRTNEVGGPGFAANLRAWDALCARADPSPRLVVGVPGGPGAADYFPAADEVAGVVAGVRGMGLARLGGFSVWDAGRVERNPGFAEALRSAASG